MNSADLTTKHFHHDSNLAFNGNFNSRGGSVNFQSSLNVYASEKVVDRSLKNSTILDLKLGEGHVVNLRFRPTKGFVQYNFGTYGLIQSGQSWSLQPYAFYLKSQVLKKDIAGAGFEIFASPNFVQHVPSTAPPGLPASPREGVRNLPKQPALAG